MHSRAGVRSRILLLLCLAACGDGAVEQAPLEPLRADIPDKVPLSQQPTRWSARAGGADSDALNGIAATREGALMAAGYTTGRFDAGCGSTVPYGASDVILIRFSSPGLCEWQLRWGAPGTRAWATSVAVAEDDAIYVTGVSSGTLDLGTTKLTAGGFVVKLTSDGAIAWAKSFENAEAKSVSVFGKTVAIGGSFRGSALGLTSAGEADGFYAALFSSSGDVMYAERAGGPDNDSVNAVATDGVRLIATGIFRGAATTRCGDLESAGGTDVFVIGDARATRYGSDGDEAALAVALAPDGDIVLAGHFDKAIDFGHAKLEGRGGFVARLGSYAHALGEGAAIALAMDGDTVYVGGEAPGPYLARVGGFREDYPVTHSASVRSVAVTRTRVVATGYFLGTLDLVDRLHLAEGQDAFVVARPR
jgi:hypothetical protein